MYNIAMKNTLLILLVLGVVCVVAYSLYSNTNTMRNISQNSASEQQTTSTEESLSTAITIDEVAKHNTLADCWSVINDKVYNLTNFAPKHKGGAERIELICGKDGSSLFGKQHGGAPQPELVLKNLQIGVLTK